MIARHIPIRSIRRSSFRDLVAYITKAKDKQERIGRVRVTNCHQQEAQDAVHEVLATQLQNRRACSDKTYHLLISFDSGDSPSAQMLREIEDEVCEALGFGGHQRVSCVHTDTDNLHIHVAINKIHPQKLTIHNPYCDYKALGAVCERLEAAHKLIHTNHETITRGARSAAQDMEHAAGVESLLGWIRRECLEELRQAKDWAGLHEALGRSGLALQERGNGLIVSDREGRMVKASSISRELSKAQLEKRFGPFVPNDRQLQAARAYQMRPLPAGQGAGQDTDELYLRYRAERARRGSARARIQRELHQQKRSLMNNARDSAKKKRGLVRQLGCDSFSKRLLYHQASEALRAQVQSIHDEHRTLRIARLANMKPVSWLDWLAQRAAMNDDAALAALRRRKRGAQRRANSLSGTMRQKGLPAAQGSKIDGVRIDSVTRHGTIIYAQGKSAIRDSGERLEVSSGISQAGLETALLMAAQRFGARITLAGDTAFRERVLRTSEALQLPVTFTGAQQSDTALPDEQQHQKPHLNPPFKPSLTMAPEAANPGEEAARRYIAEREAKRLFIPGIPKHVLGRLTPGDEAEEARYAGWRRVEGQLLLLTKTGCDEIAVMPVDAATLARISKIKLGEAIRLEGREPGQSRGLRL